MIFEFSDIFTSYLTYYEPITKKKVDLAQLRARPHAGAPPESIFDIFFEYSAVFTCYLTYYKPIAKKVDLARPRARRGRAVGAQCARNGIFLYL